MEFHVNNIQIGGIIEQKEVVTYGNDKVIWFKIKASRTIKDKVYITSVPVRIRASEWALRALENGLSILLIGRLHQTEKSGLYAVPTEKLEVFNGDQEKINIDPEFITKIGSEAKIDDPKTVKDAKFILPKD